MTAEQPTPDPQWVRAGLITLALHGAGLAYLLASASAPEGAPTEMAPFAIELAPPSPPQSAPPSDLPVDEARPETLPQPTRTPPPTVDVITTARGTIGRAQPTPPVTDTPSAALTPAKAAAAPPGTPALPATKPSSAPVLGASSATSAATPSWEATVRAKLERAKRYPPGARIMKQQDVIILAFHVDGSGRVSGARIKRSSGYEELEAEALSLIARVSPLPPPPGGAARDLSVPIQFHIDP